MTTINEAEHSDMVAAMQTPDQTAPMTTINEELPTGDQNNNEEVAEKGNPANLQSKKRSMVWDHFTKNGDPKCRRAVCNYCGVSYAIQHKRSGTSNMRNHLESQCKKYPQRLDKMKQMLLSFSIKEEKNGEGTPTVKSSLKNHLYNYDACRRAVVEMIMCDELPFRFVEGKGFIKLCQTLEPRFIVPSRMSITRDCMKLYEEEKAKLKLMLKGQRVCLTTDAWTSIQNINYMCVTVHWIDENWKLNKRIINLLQVANHRGETIGKSVESCMLSWGIDKLLTLTVDNASSNDVAITHIKKISKRWPQTVLENEHLHVRCCAHVLNLVVQDGLKEIDESVIKIRNAVRFIRSSPSRLLAFKECCEKEKIETKCNLCLDVETRWNSTYLMLESAAKFEKAFERLGEDEPRFISYFDPKKNLGPPTEMDWKNARVLIKFLKLFYQVTLKFSSSLYVTSNEFFHEIIKIHTRLSQLSLSGDMLLSSMAIKMKIKFAKYWEDPSKVNKLLFFAVVLDPRFKLKYVEFCLSKIYDEVKALEVFLSIEKALNRLFRFYESHNPCRNDGFSMRFDKEHDLMSEDEGENSDMKAVFMQKIKAQEQFESTSELQKYLNDGYVQVLEPFDILAYWKSMEGKYPCLAIMAREVFAVPISTVSSESAFSTTGRIVDPYRSCLLPKTVEALLCTQNWLRSNEKLCDLREVLDDVETFEEFRQEPISKVLLDE